MISLTRQEYVRKYILRNKRSFVGPVDVPDNQNTDVPAFIDQVTRQNAGLVSNVSLGSDAGRLQRYVEDGSYVRLKDITLGYSLPQNILNKIGAKKARAYVSGTNLITLTKYTGYDTEASAYNNNDAQIWRRSQ